MNVEDNSEQVEDGVNVNGEVNPANGPLEPVIDMLFDDAEEDQTFFKAYAR